MYSPSISFLLHHKGTSFPWTRGPVVDEIHWNHETVRFVGRSWFQAKWCGFTSTSLVNFLKSHVTGKVKIRKEIAWVIHSGWCWLFFLRRIELQCHCSAVERSAVGWKCCFGYKPICLTYFLTWINCGHFQVAKISNISILIYSPVLLLELVWLTPLSGRWSA